MDASSKSSSEPAAFSAPQAPDRQAGEAGRFALPDGLQLYYRDYAPKAIEGDKRRPAIVCLHGLTRNSRDFEALAPLLAERGFRVVAPDMRGRGRSDRDLDPNHYQVPTYIADTKALIAHLGLSAPIVIGTSMGGLIAMGAELSAPGTFCALALNDIGPAIEQAGLDRIRSYVGARQAFASWDEAVSYVRALDPDRAERLDEAALLTLAKRLCVEDPDGQIRLDYDPQIARPFDQAYAGDRPQAIDPWALWAGIGDLPILVLRGEHSDILTRETLTKMAQGRSRLRSVEVPNVGHAPLLDEQEALDALLGFVCEIV